MPHVTSKNHLVVLLEINEEEARILKDIIIAHPNGYEDPEEEPKPVSDFRDVILTALNVILP